ncbi:hypothetical protein FocTR4_00010994 [Fusarium oxysporum f. sp. cubense]|uniref:Uncharacterized protein n=1 Tax=Fusarium oxysporum f. sp. cubense TaxID=61366 RepID=A0A5C6SGB5_FUSOC|nr:hypothetical protein FocTR4_00010994 [Fusarium oxysporum f. sp. cubense]
MLRIYPLHCYFPNGGRLLSELALLFVFRIYRLSRIGTVLRCFVLHASGYDGVDTARWEITLLATAALMFRLAGKMRDVAMSCE